MVHQNKNSHGNGGSDTLAAASGGPGSPRHLHSGHNVISFLHWKESIKKGEKKIRNPGNEEKKKRSSKGLSCKQLGRHRKKINVKIQHN